MTRPLVVYWALTCELLLFAGSGPAAAQDASAPGATHLTAEQPTALESEFFAGLREGDAKKFLTYIPEQGMNVGPRAERVTRAEIEQQFAQHRDLYCKLFDSSCIRSPIKLDAGVRACSYRELLTNSEKVRTAATEAVRGGVRQAILVAEVKNDECGGLGLIDFIFNEDGGRWKLFSAP